MWRRRRAHPIIESEEHNTLKQLQPAERVYSDNIAKEKNWSFFWVLPADWTRPSDKHEIIAEERERYEKRSRGCFHAIFILGWRTELLRVVLDQKHFYSATGESTWVWGWTPPSVSVGFDIPSSIRLQPWQPHCVHRQLSLCRRLFRHGSASSPVSRDLAISPIRLVSGQKPEDTLWLCKVRATSFLLCLWPCGSSGGSTCCGRQTIERWGRPELF